MPADDYLILLGHLLDDDLNEEQQQRLLSILEQHPEKLPDIMRHLELWELYSQSVCTERSAERFLASWETRVAAVADADQFIQDVERRLEATSVAEQARIQEIKQRAQRELEQFLAEHKPVAPARESRRRKEWHVGERIRKGLENFCNLLVMSLKVVRVLAVCLAVALAIPTTLRYIQAKRIVATLDDSVGAKWTTPPEQPQLRRGWLELQEGFAQLGFKGGAQAILQAPCKLRLESSEQLFLETGTLTVKLAESEQTFLVRTSHSTIKDLGTEFGVIVKSDGRLETQVYEGKVQLAQGDQPKSMSSKQVLEKGQAAGVTATGDIVSAVFDTRRFTRALPENTAFGLPGKRVNLADVLVGGNGFGTGDPNQMVDIRTGLVSDIRHDLANTITQGQSGYISNALPGVDYLFTADVSDGPLRVSSTGHTFTECPDTNGEAYPYISNRGLLRHIPGVVATQVLNGREFGSRLHPVISIHANAGLTFDLDALRSVLPGVTIKRFTALCGISENAGIARLREQGAASLHRADFFVLVDGQVRFDRRGMQVPSGGAPVQCELDDSDRFLTLVVTDGGDGNGYDWGVFAEPALLLE